MAEAIRSPEPNPTRSSASTTTSEPAPTGRELAITRIVDASRARVFKAWTDPKHVTQWWGPHGR